MSWEGEGPDATIRAASDDPWLGRVLKNKYRLEHLLGAGGFGTVYAARQLLIGTWHAVKLLHAPNSSQPELVDRFREEARIGTRLRHPRIVTVTDFDVEGESFFLVMDFIESTTLAQALRQAPDDVSSHAEPWARDIAAALDYAHAQGVVHRDLKPSNVLIRQQDQAALLTDFGISRWLHSVGVTQAGMAIGTHAYMSPEQCAGEERAIDARSDVYSFAALLFELECGRPPFGTGREAMVAHLYQAVPSVRQFRPNHPAAEQLDAVFGRGLAKSSDQRPQSARELAEEFLGAQAGVSPPPWTPVGPKPRPRPTSPPGLRAEKTSTPPLWRMSKFKAVGAAAGVLILGLTAGGWFLVRPPGGVPEPDVQSMVPSHFTVRNVAKFALDGGPIPERVVESAGPLRDVPCPTSAPPSIIASCSSSPHKNGYTQPADLQVLQWDASSARWTVVFDAARVTPKGSDSTILPADKTDSTESVDSFFSAKLDVHAGQQLVFKTSVSGGAHTLVGVGVLDYLNGKFQLVDWRAYDGRAQIEAVGPPTAQFLRITSRWITPFDQIHAPVRDYWIDLSYPEGQAVIQRDDRPLLGVGLVYGAATGSLRVGGVMKGSPADGVLEWGDTLIDVDGQQSAPSAPDAGVTDVIALRHPGDRVTIHFDRDGTRREATVTLQSMAARDVVSRSYLGLDAADGSTGRKAGALIEMIAPGGPAATAGLTPGLLIVSVGHLDITSSSDLTLTEFHFAPGTRALVTYLDSAGKPGETTITLGTPPPIPSKSGLSDDYKGTFEC